MNSLLDIQETIIDFDDERTEEPMLMPLMNALTYWTLPKSVSRLVRRPSANALCVEAFLLGKRLIYRLHTARSQHVEPVFKEMKSDNQDTEDYRHQYHQISHLLISEKFPVTLHRPISFDVANLGIEVPNAEFVEAGCKYRRYLDMSWLMTMAVDQ